MVFDNIVLNLSSYSSNLTYTIVQRNKWLMFVLDFSVSYYFSIKMMDYIFLKPKKITLKYGTANQSIKTAASQFLIEKFSPKICQLLLLLFPMNADF